MTKQDKLIIRWWASIDPVYRAYDPCTRRLMRATLIGDRVGLAVAVGQLWHAIRWQIRAVLK